MEKNNLHNKKLAFTVLLLIAVIAVGSIMLVLGNLQQFFIDTIENNVQVTSTAIVTETGTDGLKKFANNTKYVFTDSAKVNEFRAGTETYDISTVTVNSSETLGTQKNPHVITTVDEWDAFVKKIAIDSTHGSGQYYVLGADIDFDGKDFHPVASFSGTFCGLGYALKNIKVVNWQYWNTASKAWTNIGSSGVTRDAYGVFCEIIGGVIVDLIVSNYLYPSPGNKQAIVTGHGPEVGGVVGIIYGGSNFVLNCHAQGEINIASSCHVFGGGIVGMQYTASSSLTIYRCSAQTVANVNITGTDRVNMVSGILGRYWQGNKCEILDCASNLDGKYSGAKYYVGTAASVCHSTNGTINLENYVGKMDIISPVVDESSAVAHNQVGNLKFKNCYGEGYWRNTETATRKSLYATNRTMTLTDNVNTVQSSNGMAGNGYNGNVFNSTELLTSKARNDVGTKLPSNIWDASKIAGGANNPDGVYDPDHSPVRNFLVATVTFKNLLSEGNESNISNASGVIPVDDYMSGDTLPTPTEEANHKFLGWIEKSDNLEDMYKAEPFKTLPSGMFGDVTLYAVWGLSDGYASSYITDSLTADKNTIEYGNNDSITLTAKITNSGAALGNNAKITYKFKQGTATGYKATNTNGSLTLRNVLESGRYTYDFEIRDGREPLWSYSAASNSSQTVTIEKAKLANMKIEDFEIDSNTIPYYGKNIGLVNFDVTLKNKAGETVTQDKHSWGNDLYTIVKETNNIDILVEPLDKDNYESSYRFAITFEAQILKMYFDIPALHDTLEHEIQYNQNLGANLIISYFQEAYLDAMNNKWDQSIVDSLVNSSYAPYLRVHDDGNDGKAYAPITADSSNLPLFAENLTAVTDEVRIDVKMETVKYTVTFNPNNGNGTIRQEQYSYGQYLLPQQQPTPPAGELFVGWYFDTVDDTGAPVNRAWRFEPEGGKEPDRVTGQITLKAEYIAPNELTEIKVTPLPSKNFYALDTIKEGDLTVIAVYKGNKDGIEVSREVPLTWDQYKNDISYLSMSGSVLHVITGGDGLYEIEVGYTFNNDRVAGRTKIRVLPIDITDKADSINFGDSDGVLSFEYQAGVVRNVREIPSGEYPLDLQGKLLGITYKYSLNGSDVDADQVINVGMYTVTVEFETTSDYTIRSKELSLRIQALTEVKIVWSATSLQYKGESQHPEAKVYYADGGSEVAGVTPEYEGDVNAKDVKTGYKVTAKLPSNYKIVEGRECTFAITTASLEVPTFRGGMTYNGQDQNVTDYLDGYSNLLFDIVSGETGKDVNSRYYVTLKIKEPNNCVWADGSTGTKRIQWAIDKAQLILDWDKWLFESDGTSGYAPKISDVADGLASGESIDYDTAFTYKVYDEEGNEITAGLATELGSYKIVVSLSGDLAKNYDIDEVSKEWDFVVTKEGMTVITIEWGETEFLQDGNVHYPTYTVKDANGNTLSASQVANILKFNDGYNTHSELGTFRITATLLDSENYIIRSGGVCVFKIVDENGYAPDEIPPTNPSGDEPVNPDNNKGGGIDVSNIGEFLKEYWQAIASGISIILIIAFLAKTAGYESRRKKANKKIDKYENAVYAATVTGLFGWASSAWTAIACVFMGLAAASLVIMIIAKSRCSKAEDELEEAKEQYDRNKESSRRDYDDNRHSDELQDLKSILMQMMSGGNMNGMNMGQGMPQGMYMGTQQGIGPEDMRMMINETVSALLPGMQQMLPQQASANDELVKKLIEKEERNDETIKELMEQNEKLMQDNAQNQKTMQEMMQKLAEKPAQKIVEKEVAATNANDENFKRLLEDNAKNQEIMQALIKQLANQPVQQVVASQPQIIERVVEKPVEKIVEKEVRVEVPVEKVVEKPVVHVVSTEAAGGAEKSKQVKPAPKKETAPRLTLEEAYAKLTKEQKKYFDGLREYAMKKDSKCKEKLATYFTTIGPSTTNPLIKLTIKKGVTVALFKMEDEYLKDIRRNAGSDGTKIKVKETEMPIGDAQAFDTAKDMIDLRIDQIERYNDFLKEQRAMKRK